MDHHLHLNQQSHKPHQLQKDPKEIPRPRQDRQDQREHQAHPEQKEVLLQKHLVQKGHRAQKGVLHQEIQAQQDHLLNRKDRPHLLDHLSLLCQVVQGHLGRQEGPRPRGPRAPQDPMEELSRHRRLLDP